MRIAAWAIALLLLVAGFALCVDALTTTHSVWLSIPMLLLAGALLGPGAIALVALLGLFDLVIEVDGHRLEFHKPESG
ncbi:MAG TPA: hypothetical protein VEI03_08940 [Stellaceae bacterium]|nr:hypothetical protein [Stellaceae bacterium]